MLSINIHCSTANIRPDCENIDIRPSQLTDEVRIVESYLFEKMNNNVDNIYVNLGGIESIHFDEFSSVIQSWFEALKPNGKLYIEIYDLYFIANELSYDKITIGDFSSFYKNALSFHDLGTIKSFMESIGFKPNLITRENRICKMEFVK